MGEINWKDKCFVSTIFLVNPENNKVLLTWNKNMQTWIPVGGHIELGEIPQEAIKREVEEETGFEFDFIYDSKDNHPENIPVYRVKIDTVPHHNKHINFVFIGRLTKWNDKKETDENEKLKWFSKPELESMSGKMIELIRHDALEAIKLVGK